MDQKILKISSADSVRVDSLYQRISNYIEQARQQVQRTIDSENGAFLLVGWTRHCGGRTAR